MFLYIAKCKIYIKPVCQFESKLANKFLLFLKVYFIYFKSPEKFIIFKFLELFKEKTVLFVDKFQKYTFELII